MSWSVGAGIEGRTVTVTGATGGIGQAVTRAFSATGARILATDVDQVRLDTLLSELPGVSHVGLAMELTNPDSQQNLIDFAVKEMGGPCALVHLDALLKRRSSLDHVTEDHWDAQIDTNLKTTFFLSRRIANEMKEQGGWINLFTLQSWWRGGFGGSSVYAASKGGVVSLSKGLARNYGRYGITVNAVSPAQINTLMLLTGLDPKIYQKMRDETPLGYVVEPEDVAGVVVFLASSHASYMAGTVVNCKWWLFDVLVVEGCLNGQKTTRYQ